MSGPAGASDAPEPPRPATRPEGASVWRRIRLARRDLFSAQPARLYRAWMAEQRTPFYRSYVVNQPELVRLILQDRPADFPKSEIIGATLRQMLGRSVFVTNGPEWEAQRRIIDPAFAGGRLARVLPAMQAAGDRALARLDAQAGAALEVEAETARLAADIIFRTLFSVPIEDRAAAAVFQAFRAYQRAQPLMVWADLLRLPAWVPRRRSRRQARAATEIRSLIGAMVTQRAAEIEAGTAPDDLATRIMVTPDPETGRRFDTQEMADQVAIFFLAGHETSASALAWGLYLLATAPQVQARARAEVDAVLGDRAPEMADLRRLEQVTAVFRETLRLYPPVPMMVRETVQPEHWRDRDIPRGSLAILSAFHLHRHERLWDRPHAFDPDRWLADRPASAQTDAYMPFSKGPRICPGAGFAMIEGVMMLALVLRRFEIEAVGPPPRPVAHLTLRAADGIHLRFRPRGGSAAV
ncbi:cytochrome P450 [Oceanomicrobium pacificus]|uniref:Cytochrome P450 n=1 Tax=Oceanomicrobium pacificus TaxID=2692916 RepID=A0A6B0TZB2_9RHOB|nr:cytochrome P450 [Oceanomicrobium pacificus]MXU66353.1 cytochrome P450 [Oceanomicrobium pacificus]